VTIDRRVGRMLRRNFHQLEVLETAAEPLPDKILPRDAIGARIIESCSVPHVICFGRLALYLRSENDEIWKTVPYLHSVQYRHNGASPSDEKELHLLMNDGERITITTHNLSGILSAIRMESALKKLAL